MAVNQGEAGKANGARYRVGENPNEGIGCSGPFQIGFGVAGGLGQKGNRRAEDETNRPAVTYKLYPEGRPAFGRV